MGKGKKTKNKKPVVDEVTEERFLAAETRPHFRRLPQNKSKVVLDERFSSVLTDPRFQLQEKDKYGRKKKKKKKKKQVVKDELSAFYTVEDDEKKDSGESQESDNESFSSRKSDESKNHADKEKSSDSESENEIEDPASRIAYLTAFSRGELDVSSSSNEDDESESSDDEGDEDGEDPVHGTAGVLDPSNKEEEIEVSYGSSPYLVVTNMDWGHVKAIDIFAILSSFSPPGSVEKVQIFQSDYGMEKMAKDKIHGPSGIWKRNKEEFSDHGDDESNEISDSDGESSNNGEEIDVDEAVEKLLKAQTEKVDSDFDAEKLRAYEASKMKYYFAVVRFSNPDNADIAYREVDGLEFEHSSAAVDLRTIPADEVDHVVNNRPMRDEATSIPSNYEPPEFILSALQQTNVQCTWDQGDVERERKLTKYSSGGWQDEAEADDLKAYLASDASSDDDSDGDKACKGSRMRKLLGLDSDAEDGDASESEANASESEDEEEDMEKEIKFIPGQKSLEDKIRSKLQQSNDEPKELTPWEKYQEKRKAKRRERRQAARNKRRDGSDQEAKDRRGRHAEPEEESDGDEFFSDYGRNKNSTRGGISEVETKERKRQQDLELLLAGEHDEEEARDYDIRGIMRMEKNKGKKLRGSRKRKEEKLAADVSGGNFKVDVHDNRFAAVLDGSDDRFGIDKTDPNYKETSAMHEILSEQTKRRKKKRRKTSNDEVVPDVSAESAKKTTGSSALSSLVKRLKSKVSNQ